MQILLIGMNNGHHRGTPKCHHTPAHRLHRAEAMREDDVVYDSETRIYVGHGARPEIEADSDIVVRLVIVGVHVQFFGQPTGSGRR